MADFLIVECQQGSPEWHQARRGVITASMFTIARQWVGGLTEQQAEYVRHIEAGKSRSEAAALAGYRNPPTAQAVEIALDGGTPGDFSDAAKRYARTLALESIGAEFPDQYETWAMRRGRELEPEARQMHEMALSIETGALDQIIKPAGFVTTPDGRFGASADGLIDSDPDGPGGAEYKCFIDPDKVWSIIMDDDWSDLTDQVQGGLWITGRRWWDMCLYCPGLTAAGLAFTRKRVYRDDDYIDALERDLMRFSRLVDDYTAQAQARANPAAAAA